MIEYLLILVVVVAVAVLMTGRLVGRSQDNSGIIINKWVELNQFVGQDLGD